jgi:hypothetical protein
MFEAPPPNLSAILSAARQRIFDDGYKAGYDAGYRAAVDALLEEFPGDKVSDPSIVDHQVSSGSDTTREQARQSHYSGTAIAVTASGRAAPGSIKNLVRSFVLTADKPVTEADFARRHPDVLRPSRYMAFRTLRQEGVIAKQDGRWVPAPAGAAKPDAGASGPDQPTDSGGSGD